MKITIYLIVVVISSMISACDSSVHNGNNSIEEVILYSPGSDRPTYKLSVPSDYLSYNAESGSALVKAAYPGMISFSPEIRHRFYDENGAWGPDLIRIFFGLRSQYEGNDREIVNRNAAGKFSLESISRWNQRIVENTSEHIKQSENVKRIIFPNEKEYQKTYLITQDSGRVSIIRCSYKTSCEGTTSWEEKIAITYQFNRENIDNMVDLDSSVINLFNTFNPTLIIDEKRE